MTTLQLPHSFQIQRCGLMLAVLVLVNMGQLRADVIKIEPPTSDRVVYESKERPDILDEKSPKGLRLVQISTDPSMISHHMYPEAHMFTPDSKRFIFHRMPTKEDLKVITSTATCICSTAALWIPCSRMISWSSTTTAASGTRRGGL